MIMWIYRMQSVDFCSFFELRSCGFDKLDSPVLLPLICIQTLNTSPSKCTSTLMMMNCMFNFFSSKATIPIGQINTKCLN